MVPLLLLLLVFLLGSLGAEVRVASSTAGGSGGGEGSGTASGDGAPRVPLLLLPDAFQSLFDVQTSGKAQPNCTAVGKHRLGWLNETAVGAGCAAALLTRQYDSGHEVYKERDGVTVHLSGSGAGGAKGRVIGEFDAPATTAELKASLGGTGDMVNYMRDEGGYAEGRDMVVLSYDWRDGAKKTGGPKGTRHAALVSAVEALSGANGNQSVVIVGNGLGGLVGYEFLLARDAAWKRKYIAGFVPVATPWFGRTALIPQLLYPSSDLIVAVDKDRTADMALLRSMQSVVLDLLPSNVRVETPKGNYSAETLSTLFLAQKNDTELTRLGGALRNAKARDVTNLTHPGVDVYCFYATNVRTHRTFIYKTDKIDAKPIHPESEALWGDGLALHESASACEAWRNVEGFRFERRESSALRAQFVVGNINVQANLLDILLAVYARQHGRIVLSDTDGPPSAFSIVIVALLAGFSVAISIFGIRHCVQRAKDRQGRIPVI